MVGMEEGLLPHQRSLEDGGRGIEEERRLCYVGVTRARDALCLSFCRSRMKWGTPRHSIPSRFMMEMRGETERAKKAAEAAAVLFGKKPAEPEPAASEPNDSPAPPQAAAGTSERRRRARREAAKRGARR